MYYKIISCILLIASCSQKLSITKEKNKIKVDSNKPVQLIISSLDNQIGLSAGLKQTLQHNFKVKLENYEPYKKKGYQIQGIKILVRATNDNVHFHKNLWYNNIENQHRINYLISLGRIQKKKCPQFHKCLQECSCENPIIEYKMDFGLNIKNKTKTINLYSLHEKYDTELGKYILVVENNKENHLEEVLVSSQENYIWTLTNYKELALTPYKYDLEISVVTKKKNTIQTFNIKSNLLCSF